MSELIQKNDNRATIRWKLLTGASALALTAYVSTTAAALAGDDGAPLFQIELGGQLSHLSNSQEKIDPPFFADIAAIPGFESPLKLEKPALYSIDEYGKLSFQPKGSDWSFSASIRYGRSHNRHKVHNEEFAPVTIIFPATYYSPETKTEFLQASAGKFSDTQWNSSEKHAVLDFQAGRDVGLGLFGRQSTSTLSAGVRIAQFSSRSKADVNADTTIQYPTHPLTNFAAAKYRVKGDLYWEHDYNQRSFKGIGPSISWQGSAPIAGNQDSAEIAIDWGIDAAVLFGRQKARGHHQSSSLYINKNLSGSGPEAVPTSVGPYVVHYRSRNVTVPNIGGSIGLSFVTGDAKVSFGYRADLFMGAMDTGIDAAKKSNMLFHGPYASISIGLGD